MTILASGALTGSEVIAEKNTDAELFCGSKFFGRPGKWMSTQSK